MSCDADTLITSASSVSTTASPLQRMASITNSLVSQPPLASAQHLSAKPMKAVLPPITQQQFDLYANVNTEDIVKRVRFFSEIFEFFYSLSKGWGFFFSKIFEFFYLLSRGWILYANVNTEDIVKRVRFSFFRRFLFLFGFSCKHFWFFFSLSRGWVFLANIFFSLSRGWVLYANVNTEDIVKRVRFFFEHFCFSLGFLAKIFEKKIIVNRVGFVRQCQHGGHYQADEISFRDFCIFV